MIKRRTSLEWALVELEDGSIGGVSAIVVNLGWWERQSAVVQGAYRHRCAKLGIELRADDALSRHFVELGSGRDDPPLSTEYRV